MSTEILSYALITHWAINCHVEGLTTETLMPESNIQSSQSLWTSVFNVLLILTSTSWQREVHPSGICSTSTQAEQCFGYHFDVGFENILNPFHPCTLTHLCIFLATILTASEKFGNWFLKSKVLSFFEEKDWSQLCTIYIYRYSQSGSFCFIGWRRNAYWFVPFHYRIFFEWQMKKIGVRSTIRKNLGLWCCSLIFGWI